MKIGWKINMYSLGYNHLLYQINVINEELKCFNMKITAKWAREEADKNIGEEVRQQVLQCEEAIKNAVRKNEMATYVYIWAKPRTIKELETNGFKVKQYDDQREGTYLHISW